MIHMDPRSSKPSFISTARLPGITSLSLSVTGQKHHLAVVRDDENGQDDMYPLRHDLRDCDPNLDGWQYQYPYP